MANGKRTATVQPSLSGLDLGPIPRELEDEDREAQTLVRRTGHVLDHREEAIRTADAVVEEHHPARPMTVADLEQRAAMIAKVGEVAIKSTTPQDWTLYKDKEGKIVGVLRDSGAVNVRKWMGISIMRHRNTAKMTEQSVPEALLTQEVIEVPGYGKDPARKLTITIAEMWADGYCRMTDEYVEAVFIGLRSHDSKGRQDFVGRGTPQDIKASARTSLDTKVVRYLSGLRKVDSATLIAMGIDLARCYKGSGYGTSTDRGANAVSEEGLDVRKDALRKDILRRVGGDEAAAKDLLKDITKWKDKDQKERWSTSVDQLTQGFQVDKAEKALAAHKVFGDAARGAAPAGGDEREPGGEG